ncbi:MAG: tRNA uridine-5-carboxymethylaminomethyl(34) synthesis enzyme MnmG [bacterium]
MVSQKQQFEVVVAGGGHAGCEAALASARMGATTLLITMNIPTIAQMSCNPAIGGPAKGHLVKEIDALGGEMGKAIDDTGIHFRMLNLSKGPAVWAPRAQADRLEYAIRMRGAVESQPGLAIFQGMVVDIEVTNNHICGVITETGHSFKTRSVILTCGTFLNGLTHIGLQSFPAGRAGEFPAVGLTENLGKRGFRAGRLKTGTPPRVSTSSIDFAQMEPQPGDPCPRPFSYQTDSINTKQMVVYISHTNPQTHKILRSGLKESPLYSGKITGIGARYCPSIEDKIVKFKERDRHHLFIEPEGRYSQEYYINGFATSLPESVQRQALKTVPGFKQGFITRLGYAIEYDYFFPDQLKPTLETKLFENLYFAGQINGTSGYEEAAAQGLVAGINAVLKLNKKDPLLIDRSQGYMGVLIDDLVTKGTDEPYRLFTSRAEYRLLIRQDNADQRFMRLGNLLGLIPDEHIKKLEKKEKFIKQTLKKIHTIKPDPEKINKILKKVHTNPIAERQSVYRLLKRPQVTFTALQELDEIATLFRTIPDVSPEVQEQVEIEVKYEGYFQRQREQIERFKQMENKKIPSNFNYASVTSISTEAREKLQRIQPRSLGQASRISGVSPSDISALTVILFSRKR